jgi:uncharacterized membrane protein YfcA
MPPWPEVTAVGAAIGVLFGLFGVGGSSFATPLLALLGVPAIIAVAAPLPATIPAAISGARAYLHRGELDRDVARWSITGGVPATIAGALLSGTVGGKTLLIASGVVLAVVGARILLPITADNRVAGKARRRAGIVIPAAAAIGFFTGLLANGGGFLLVPLFVLVLGLSMQRAAGSSLVVVAALSVPTLLTHWALGHIDWTVALAFAAGAIPGAMIGSRLAQRVTSAALRTAFAWLLIVFAAYFLVRQLLSL